MKRKNLFIWLLMLGVCIASCSDDATFAYPDPKPEPPAGELIDGVNQFPKEFKATGEAEVIYKVPSGSALYGYTGDLYLYTGIVEGSDWLYNPAAWGVNTDKCKMKKVEDNVWSISFSPTIREWFGVAEGITVQQIGMVFRSADGTVQSDDYFADVEDEAPFVPNEVRMGVQPAGTRDGINIRDATTVTLVLYDRDLNGSRKDYAYLIGDFNEWKLSHDYQMFRDEATGCWWYTLTNLDPQIEYGFQYYLGTTAGGPMRIADAYTEKVLDAQDQNIPASTYPGLREYPSDKTAGIISTFQTQPQTYSWRVNDFQAPDKNNLIIYEMLFRDFTESGDINGAMQKLDYLKQLGVNAIELMPVQEFDGNDSWGYNPCFYFAMDKAYGTKERYKEFIDECHSRGIAVILDVVYNHATGAHSFAKLYWDASNNKTADNNPWFNVDAPHPYSVFHDFNHESLLVRQFVKRNLEFLLTEYKIDGFRFDLTKGFTQNSSTESTASNYDASRIAILEDYNSAIKAVNPDAYVILEHFCVESEEKELGEAGMQLWRNLNKAYAETAMGWPGIKTDFSALTTQGTTMPFGSWVGYMESHDEERVSFAQTEWGQNFIATDLATRMKQLEVNSSFFFTVSGPKMIWQFGELGYDVSIEENGRTGKKPIKWDYLTDTNRKQLHDTYSKLIALRNSQPSLFEENSSFVWSVKESNWASGRTITLSSFDGKGLVVVGNFTAAEITATAEFPSTGVWYNYMSGDMKNVSSNTESIQVPAHSFYVYTTFQ